MAETERYIVDADLETWLEQMETAHPESFPTRPGSGYTARYKLLAAYMNDEVHTEVEKGDLLEQLKALLKQVSDGELTFDQVRYLNDHGPQHVQIVIERASDLLRQLEVTLAPYEAYFLLLAIHFHDVGIAYGRNQHETKCWEVMNLEDVRACLGDTTERKDIARISSAHSGLTRDGDKDTISQITISDPEERFGRLVRFRFLAAILRFADELADDRNRASRMRLQDNSIPRESELYHAYSHSLQSVLVKGQEISLTYELVPETAERKFAKDGKKVYLLDEIYDRTEKMHGERMYCMRFWPPEYRWPKSIRATVNVCMIPLGAGFLVPEKKITFTLKDEGYPGPPRKSRCRLCLAQNADLPRGTDLAKGIRQQRKQLGGTVNKGAKEAHGSNEVT